MHGLVYFITIIRLLKVIAASIFNASNGVADCSVAYIDECIIGVGRVEVFRKRTVSGTGPVSAN